MRTIQKCRKFGNHQFSFQSLFKTQCYEYTSIQFINKYKVHYSTNISLNHFRIDRTYSTEIQPKSKKNNNDYYKPNFILNRDKIDTENEDNMPWIVVFLILVPCWYLLFESLYSSSGKYKIRNQTFDLIKQDPKIKLVLGNSMLTRKIKCEHKFVDDEGLKRCQLIYKIKGDKNNGKVYVEMVRNDKNKKWIMEYCIIKPIYKKSKKQYYNTDILEYDFKTKRFKHSDIYVSYKNKDIITYYIGTAPQYLNRYNVEKAIKCACIEWSEASKYKIKFESVHNKENADIVFGWKSFENKKKTLYAHKLGCAGDGHIDFNIDKKWVIGLDDKDDEYIKNNTVFPLYTIALHELGHSLGLQHSFNPKEIMAPFHNPRLKHLADGDKQRLESLWWVHNKK